MPKTKQSLDKKKPVKKAPAKKTTLKKKPVKKAPAKKKSDINTNPKSVAQAITIDVITDNEDILFQAPIEEEAEELKSHDDLDVQKKFFSDLVSEMKDKQEIKEMPINSDLEAFAEKKTVSPRKSLRLYRRMAFQSTILTIFLLLLAAYFLLPSLTIYVETDYETISNSFDFQVIGDTNQGDNLISTSSRSLPGNLVILPIRAEKIYQASGEEILGEEVVGEVTIHNEYNRNQPLVVNTRLLSEDNKLYRLTESVNVPANSEMTVAVYADQASQEMAIGPSHFTIPGLWLGLQDRIYASSNSNFEYRHQIKRYVKQSDLDQAKIDIKNTLSEKSAKNIKTLESGLNQIAYLSDNNDLKIEVDAKLGEEIDKFTVTAENDLVVASFPQDQAEALVKAKLSFTLPEDKKLSSFQTSTITYRLEDYNAEDKVATVNTSFKASMSLRTDSEIIDKKQLAGLNQDQIAEYLRSFSEIVSYRLEFFPKFIKTAPVLPDRIKVKIMEN
ncbi:MAG: hypothetical protein EOM88_00115 [Clostridia bacterium]|nr:hypothetical protein [Clostridia bacterium]